MLGFLSIIAVGFFLGMRHATDPDHVIAVTTIVAQQRKLGRAALIGAFWGLGHTFTIFFVGTGIILFNLVIPARIGLGMELSVAVMLIVLGVMNVVSFLRAVPASPPSSSEVVHSHVHIHGDTIHSHPHSHGPEAHEPEAHGHSHNHTTLATLDRKLGRTWIYQHTRPLVVGIVHGLAGSAAVALLVLTTIRNSHWAIAYLLIFGVGTIAGMMVITMSIATTFHIVGGKRERFSQKLAIASGLLSLGFGVIVAYQICFVSGLLSAHPQWTPK